MIGEYKDMPKPKFPPRHDIKSKGKSPNEKGALPCRYCGADHWNRDCPHHKSERRHVRAHMATLDEEAMEAWNEYEDAYEDCTTTDSDTSEETTDSSEDEQ